MTVSTFVWARGTVCKESQHLYLYGFDVVRGNEIVVHGIAFHKVLGQIDWAQVVEIFFFQFCEFSRISFHDQNDRATLGVERVNLHIKLANEFSVVDPRNGNGIFNA